MSSRLIILVLILCIGILIMSTKHYKMTQDLSSVAAAIRNEAYEMADTSSLVRQRVENVEQDNKIIESLSDSKLSLLSAIDSIDKREEEDELYKPRITADNIDIYSGDTHFPPSTASAGPGGLYTSNNTIFHTLIDKHESYGNFSSLYESIQDDKNSPFFNVDVSKMTLKELMEFTKIDGEYHRYNMENYNKNSTPTGRYQIVGKTLRDIVKRGKFDLNLVYDSTTQEALFNWYMNDTLQPYDDMNDKIDAVLERWVGLKNANRNAVQEAIEQFELQRIAREGASMPSNPSLFTRRGN